MTDGAGLVVVDKSSGMTSHDVVGRCRRIFGTRKVGHAGTLDPMATGVLVVGIERATKILGMLTATDKSYAATIRLGQTTSTEDAEGEVLQTVSAAGVGESQIEESVAALRGEIDQVPSAVSAIKVDGQRAYKLAREGHDRRTRAAQGSHRPIRRAIHPAPRAISSTSTSRSTVPAAPTSARWHVTSAPRSVWAVTSPRCAEPVSARSGSTWPPAWTNSLNGRGCRYTLDEACLLTFPRRDLSASEAEDTRHGRPLEPAGIDGVYAATAADGQVISLLRDEGKRAKSVVVLRPATL